jgi:membrane-associated protein
VCLFVPLGYFFGNMPRVKENFSLVLLAIVAISVMPMAVEAIRARRSRPA